MSDLKLTKCSKCEKEIKYTIRKPKLCSTCRILAKSKPAVKAPAKKKKATGYKKRPDNKNTQGELALFGVLDKLLKEYDFINHGYYSFLPSPKKYPLQLDRYYPDLKLAFEFDGKQHEEYNKFIHKSKKNFDYYKECDKLKEKHCEDKGITLIRIAYNYKITEDAIQLDILKANKELHNQIFRGK